MSCFRRCSGTATAPRLQHASLRSSRPVVGLWQSYHTPGASSEDPFPPAETAILSAALSHVPRHGFTRQSMLRGAQDAGYIPASLSLFQRGPFDLVMYHLATQRLALKHNVRFPASPDPATGTPIHAKPMGVAVKLRTLTMERLLANAPIMHKYSEAIALMSLASNITPSVTELGRLADELWFLAGDTAVDSSWYTKRATLSSVYAATELFMTQDRSEQYRDTGKFLDRRLGDVRQFGTAAGSVSQWLSFTGLSTVNVLRSWGLRI